MEPNELAADDSTAPDERWTFEVGRQYTVWGYGPGQSLVAQLIIDSQAETLRLYVTSCRQSVEGPGWRLSPSPIAEIEAFANQPLNALKLIEMRGPGALEFLPKVLEGAKHAGRKPNHFYGMVLIMKRACEKAGKPYAETIATDNGVSTNVVYRWVAEAKRRGITIDDDPVGQVRINGEPMKLDIPTDSQPEASEPVGEPLQRVAL